MKLAIIVVVLITMLAMPAFASTFVSVTIGSIANQSIDSNFNYQAPPMGHVTLSGIPFHIPTEGNNVFETNVEGLGTDWPTSVTLGINISNPTNAYMLVTGTAVSKTFDSQVIGNFTFHYASGNSDTFILIAGDTIRDWVYHDSLVTTTSNPNVSTVWNGLSSNYPYYPAVLNMLVIPLNQKEVLTGIDVVDTSSSTTGSISPGLFLSGITIDTNPVPESSSLMAIGGGLVGVIGFRKRK